MGGGASSFTSAYLCFSVSLFLYLENNVNESDWVTERRSRRLITGQTDLQYTLEGGVSLAVMLSSSSAVQVLDLDKNCLRIKKLKQLRHMISKAFPACGLDNDGL